MFDFVLDRIFLQARFQICCYLCGLRGSGAVNLTQPVRYPMNFNDLFIYFVVVVVVAFFHYLVLQGVGQRFTNAVVLKFVRLRESSR